jgi:(1->4)-alpha-D-glucan 1-alpha-D-glucosylmutase
MMPPLVPNATYRVQFTKDFGFDDAARLVPYLKSLGVSHLYASPFLKARAGSTHGYDITDHNALNPELGGVEAFDRLSNALAEADIGLILDFVPNHMGINFADNAWWLDVLEWGQRSPHAASFDIDWDLLPHRHGSGVLLPILGDRYGKALESGDIILKYDAYEGTFSAWYYEHRLPIDPERYGDILRTVVAAAGAEHDPAGHRLLELADSYRGPHRPSYAQAPAFKAELAAVPGGADVIERGLEAYRSSPDNPAAAGTLHRLLERQHYRLAHWRLAVTEINYRRFFDINDLAGLRMEDARTFRAAHTLVAQLIAQGRLHGIRLDHIDGLRDPIGYCTRLQRVVRQAQRAGDGVRPFYVVIEKILADGERLPRFEGVAGTTGYEWLNVISRVLADQHGLDLLEQVRPEFTANPRSFPVILERAKLRVLENLLASEFTVLTRLLSRIAAGSYATRDFGIDRLRLALQEFIVQFPVYRTYVRPSGASQEDRAVILRAIDAARERWVGTDTEIFDFLQDTLTLDLIGPDRSGYSRARVIRFALKVQQFTGPMMAKSLEDTAFYRHVRLLALNEVGGDPDAPALSAEEFHRRMSERVASYPNGMTATATHDTKRGEDARARVLAISELADNWIVAVRHWQALNENLVGRVNGARAPSRLHEYMIYQTLIGAWPLQGIDAGFADRMAAYALKAAREGKVETSWSNPDEAYEKALDAFVRGILDSAQSPDFIDAFHSFAQRTALIGALNSLTQVALKATMPGVPDFYQGTELWDLSLVDPDNRRPVDFAVRNDMLSPAQAPDWSDLALNWRDGRIKLALTHRLLALRKAQPLLFAQGGYHSIPVSGPHSAHVLAFARTLRHRAAIVVVGRHFGPFTEAGRQWPTEGGWQASLHLDGFSGLRDALRNRNHEGDAVSVSQLFDAIPLAVLEAGWAGAGVKRAPVGGDATVP